MTSSKIPRKILIAFGLALLAMIEMTYYTYRNTWISSQSATEISHTHEVLYNIEQVLALTTSLEASARGYVINADDSYAGSSEKYAFEVRSYLKKLQELVDDNPIQEGRAVQLSALVESKITFINRLIAARLTSFDQAQHVIASGQGNVLMDKIHFGVSQMKNEENALLTKRVEANRLAMRNTLMTIMISSLFMLFFAAWAFYSNKSYNTKRLQAEAKARESEKKYRTIVEDAGDVVYTNDYKGIFTFVNSRAKELTGYTQEELLGKHFTGIIAPEWIEKAKQFYYKQFTDRIPTTLFEFQIITKQGQKKWVEQTVVLMPENKMVGEFHCIVRNIELRKVMEVQLLEAKEKAEEATKAKEMFLASMSHEIRTPMNGVSGMVNLLAQTPLNEEQKEYTEAIKDSANRLLTVINDILDLSKINAGKVTLHNAPFDIRQVLKNVNMTLSSKAKEKGIALNFQIDENMPAMVIGDNVRLSQVLWNLGGNAIKFTNAGKVDIIVTSRRNENGKAQITFSVKDTGIGIVKEKLAHIFEPFVQADKKITTEYGGTGLGLDISEKIVKMHGSAIRVMSEPGIGSEFSFTIEYPEYLAAVSTEHSNYEKVKNLKGINILFVEDNRVNQQVGTRTLGKWDANVVIADNGKIAIEMLKKDVYDIVLMDLQMPEMDGTDTTEYIRHYLPAPVSSVPIIAMTASAFSGEYEKCIASGMNDYISKPFNPDELYNKIKGLLFNKAA